MGEEECADARYLETSPAFQAGRDDVPVALVLAAPGLDEERAGHPAAGRTGDNLDRILSLAHGRLPDVFRPPRRRDYRIVNAVSIVLHGGRSVPLVHEIVEPGNLRRLRCQLGGRDRLAAFGAEALRAIREAGRDPTFLTGHPGFKGLNQLPVTKGTTPGDGTRVRLDLLANMLVGSFGRCDAAASELAALRSAENARRNAARR